MENRTGGQGNSIMENYAKMPLAEKLDYALKYGTSSKEMMERLKSGDDYPGGGCGTGGNAGQYAKESGGSIQRAGLCAFCTCICAAGRAKQQRDRQGA